MKIEKTIENANITDYIESVEILDGGKIKVIFDIPDDILAGCIFYNEEQLKDPARYEVETKREYDKPYIPYKRKKTKIKNISKGYNEKPIEFTSRADAAAAIGVERRRLYRMRLKPGQKTTVVGANGLFEVTAIE